MEILTCILLSAALALLICRAREKLKIASPEGGAAILLFLICLILAWVYFFSAEEEMTGVLRLCLSLVAFIVFCIIFKTKKAGRLWERLNEGSLSDIFGSLMREDLETQEPEEDYMKTKQGKIMTVICILLVIYMFFSAFCIYRLNAKINSLYEITQELKDGK